MTEKELSDWLKSSTHYLMDRHHLNNGESIYKELYRAYQLGLKEEADNEGILIPGHYTLTIKPAIQPEKRHKIEVCLEEMGFKVWGGGTSVDLTVCDIIFE